MEYLRDTDADGMVTYGAHTTEEGFIPLITIETSGGTVHFLADIVIPTNEGCADFLRAVYAVLRNPHNEPVEDLGTFT
jgi:hypothetical protein